MAELEKNVTNFPINVGPIPASAANAEKARIWAEGTDAQVEELGGTHSAKVWAETADTSNFMPKSGGTFTGDITMANNKKINFQHSVISENNAGNTIIGDGNGNGLVISKNGTGAALFTSNGASYTDLIKRSDVKSTYSSTGTDPVNGTAVAAAIAADALTNGASESSSLAVGSTTSASDSTVVGKLASASYAYSTAVGYNTYSTSLYGTAIGHTAGAAGAKAVAIGAGAIASASGAIQLGEGTNSTASTLQVGSTQLLDASGKVPTARLNAMTGADGSNAGTAGIVPAPTATDNVKYLKGDGTWAAVDNLPSQTGNSGKFLTTDGSSASWASVAAPTNVWTTDNLKAGKGIAFNTYEPAPAASVIALFHFTGDLSNSATTSYTSDLSNYTTSILAADDFEDGHSGCMNTYSIPETNFMFIRPTSNWGLDDFTFSFWIKRPSGAGTRSTWMKSDPGDRAVIEFTNGTFICSVNSGATTLYTGTWEEDEWHQYTIEYYNHKVYFYKDGHIVCSTDAYSISQTGLGGFWKQNYDYVYLDEVHISTVSEHEGQDFSTEVDDSIKQIDATGPTITWFSNQTGSTLNTGLNLSSANLVKVYKNGLLLDNGTGTVTKHLYTGVSSSTYIDLVSAPAISTADSWEIYAHLIYKDRNYGTIFGSSSTADYSGPLFVHEYGLSQIGLFAGTTGSGWNITTPGASSLVPVEGGEYFFRVGFTGQRYYLYYKQIGEDSSFVLAQNVASTYKAFLRSGSTLRFLNCGYTGGDYHSESSLYMEDLYVMINGSIVFNGATAVSGTDFTNNGCTVTTQDVMVHDCYVSGKSIVFKENLQITDKIAVEVF